MENQVNDQNKTEEQGKKKISLAEAAKLALAKKKAANNNKQSFQNHGNQKMKSQISKKPNNQRKKMGS